MSNSKPAEQDSEHGRALLEPFGGSAIVTWTDAARKLWNEQHEQALKEKSSE